jgi:hypothetical protein
VKRYERFPERYIDHYQIIEDVTSIFDALDIQAPDKTPAIFGSRMKNTNMLSERRGEPTFERPFYARGIGVSQHVLRHTPFFRDKMKIF